MPAPRHTNRIRHGRRPPRGFTLIELLVVVAIIAILVAIAMSEFHNARIRAKIARTVGDFKALQLSLNTFYLDNEGLPVSSVRHPVDGQPDFSARWTLIRLTTPVTYISTVPYEDPFNPTVDPMNQLSPAERARRKRLHMLNHYQYLPDGAQWTGGGAPWPTDNQALFRTNRFEIRSVGPAQRWAFEVGRPDGPYDPTNGLKSVGYLWATESSVFEVGSRPQ